MPVQGTTQSDKCNLQAYDSDSILERIKAVIKNR